MITSTSARITAEIGRQTQLSQDIATLQTQVSTQNRLIGDSDDPAAAAQIATIRRQQANQATYSTNIQTAQALSTRVDSALGAVSTSLTQANELVLEANNDSLSDEDRANIVNQLRGLADDITSALGQKDSNGNPIFPSGAALAIPVGDGRTITPNASIGDVVDVSTGGTTQSLSDILNAAADALSSSDSASRQTGASNALTALSDATGHVADARAAAGVRADQLTTLAGQYTDSATDMTNQRANLSGTDMSQAIATIQQKLTTLQAAQAVFAKINQQNLFSLIS